MKKITLLFSLLYLIPCPLIAQNVACKQLQTNWGSTYNKQNISVIHIGDVKKTQYANYYQITGMLLENDIPQTLHKSFCRDNGKGELLAVLLTTNKYCFLSRKEIPAPIKRIQFKVQPVYSQRCGQSIGTITVIK